MSEDKAKSIIREGVEGYIHEIECYAVENNVGIPETAVFTPTKSSREDPEKIVKKPSKLVEYGRVPGKYFLNEAVSELIETENGFDIPPGVESQKEEIVPQYYRKKLAEFTKCVLDYGGTFEFKPQAFDSAFDDHISPRYSSTHCHEVIIPLPKLSLYDSENVRNENLLLSPLISSSRSGAYKWKVASGPTISKLTDREMAGIQTYGHPHVSSKKGKTKKDLQWYCKLRTEIEIEHSPTAHSDSRPGINRNWTGGLARRIGARIGEQVLTTLRLYRPRNYVGLGPIYTVENAWLSYRNYCADISGSYNGPRSHGGPTVRIENYLLERDQFNDFYEFWERHGEICDPLDDSELSRPIRRLNQAFGDKRYEDKVIDCYLGFETTLAKERGVNRFQFPIRALLLFKNTSLTFPDGSEISLEFIYEFFEELYNRRNGIIHDDSDLQLGRFEQREEWSDDISPEDLSNREFILFGRYFLAKALQEYNKIIEQNGTTVEEINRTRLDREIVDLLKQ